MDLPINHFKRAIASGRTPLGAWLGSGAASTAEALGCVGFDFLVVDMEHTPIDTPQMIDILRAIAGTPAQAIVRPPWNDMVMIKRALDAGAQSLLLPFVQNADEARRAVSYTRYPPEGVRGVAGTHRGSRYGTVPNYLKRASEEICVIVQIETLPALDKLDEIAAVPGIDSIFIGPERSFGVDGPPWRHHESGGAGASGGCRQSLPACRQAVGHHRADPRDGRRASSTTATRGSRSAPTWVSWWAAHRNFWRGSAMQAPRPTSRLLADR